MTSVSNRFLLGLLNLELWSRACDAAGFSWHHFHLLQRENCQSIKFCPCVPNVCSSCPPPLPLLMINIILVDQWRYQAPNNNWKMEKKRFHLVYLSSRHDDGRDRHVICLAHTAILLCIWIFFFYKFYNTQSPPFLSKDHFCFSKKLPKETKKKIEVK